jgi:hypothetical protein
MHDARAGMKSAEEVEEEDSEVKVKAKDKKNKIYTFQHKMLNPDS